MVSLTSAQRAFLEQPLYAVVGTLNGDGSIQQTVVWFMLDGDTPVFSCGAESVKARNLRRNPTISLTVEDTRRYLTLSGSATVGPSDPALRLQLATRYLGAERAAEWMTQRPGAPRALVRLTLRRVYGQGV